MGIMNCTCFQGQSEDRELVKFVCEEMYVVFGMVYVPAPSKAHPVIIFI